MRFQLISLFVTLGFAFVPSAFAYEPSGLTQCFKRDQTPSRLQSHIHKTGITTYEGEEECRGIVSGKIDGDCRSTFKRHVINKGRECGHKGTNKEVYEAYKDRANKVYGFRGGFEVEFTQKGKPIKYKIPCSGFSLSKNIIVGATHCFQNHKDKHSKQYGQFFDIIKYGSIYYSYKDRGNKVRRIKIKKDNYRLVGEDPSDSFILFKVKKQIQRDNFVKLPPRNSSNDDLRSFLEQQSYTETFPEMNDDWFKKFGEKGRRKLYSKCPPGVIIENKYGTVYQHECDTEGGSSGAPITTFPKTFCDNSPNELILIAIDMWGQGKKNYARPMSGENLEAIYQFIGKVK